MPKRVAFFAGKEEVENFFNLESKRINLFEPHYNLSPGHHIPVIFSKDGEKVIERVRWGDEATQESVISSEEAVSVTIGGDILQCSIPLSGFYVWKDDAEQGNPFFVRMLNEPIMAAAGFYYRKDEYFKIITSPSNVLIRPMSKTMPMLLDRKLASKWIEAEENTEIRALVEKAGKLFLLTDLSVLRVSEEVNDPANNHEKLVQPIPK